MEARVSINGELANDGKNDERQIGKEMRKRNVKNIAISVQHAKVELSPFGKKPSMDVLLT